MRQVLRPQSMTRRAAPLANAFWSTTGGFPRPTFSLNLLDPHPLWSPAFTFGRTTEGALIQQFDGSWVKPGIGEAGLRGGRQLKNLWPFNTDDATLLNYGNATKIDYQTLSFAAGEFQGLSTTATEAGNYFEIYEVKQGTKTGTVGISDFGGGATPKVATLTTEWQRLWVLATKTAGQSTNPTLSNRVEEGADTIAGTVLVRRFMLVKARPGQTEPDPEYVSNGVDILGEELLTNGNFDDTDISDWIPVSATDSTISVVSGALRIANVSSNNGSFYRTFPVVAGKRYKASIHQDVSGGGYAVMYLGTYPADLTWSGSVSLYTTGTFTSEFTATVTGLGYLTIIQYVQGPTYADYDNITIKPTPYHGFGPDGVQWFDTDAYGTDLTTATALGPEKVTNGDFSSGTTGYEAVGSSIAVVGGEFEVTVTAGGWNSFQDIPTVVGKTYNLTATMRAAATNSLAQSCRLTLDSPFAQSFVSANGVQTNVSFDFTATVTSTRVNLSVASGGAGDVGDTAYFDNVSVKEIYPVRCTGMANCPLLTNFFHGLSAAWTKRGTGAMADTSTSGFSYMAITGLGAISVDDVYRASLVSGANDVDLGVGFAMRRVTATGTLTTYNPTGIGKWNIDVSLVSSEHFEFITKDHPAVTVVTAYKTDATANGYAGFWFYSTAGANMAVDIGAITMITGTTACAGLVPTTTTAVTLVDETMNLDKDLIGYDQAGGVWVVVHTPQTVGDSYVLELITDANSRMVVYSTAYLSVYVISGGVATWSADSTPGQWVIDQEQTIAVRFEANDGHLTSDGVSRLTDSSVTIPAITSISLGGSVNVKYAGALRRLHYFAPGTVSDARLLSLSAGNLPAIPELTL